MPSTLADRWVALWDAGAGVPDVFAFLAAEAQASVAEKLAVVLADQERRWTSDRPLTVEDYLARLPELAEDQKAKLELVVAEYRARQRSGKPASVEEFLSRFSDLSDGLATRLSAEGLVSESHETGVSHRTGEGVQPPAPATTITATVRSDSGTLVKIGRYRLVRILGEGGYGRVWLGQDEELRRYVAIKVPTPERFREAKDAEAYLAEARTLASLDHPNIVPVYDVGKADDGSIYVVSKFIEGSDLARRIKEARPNHAQAAALAATIAQALQHAHQKRLIHRDIKPANILIDEESDRPYLTDFGLALREEDFAGESGLAGTPAYMSPEQARGEGHRLDGRSDIFSLGVVFYELLTGKRPFRGSTAHEVLHQITSVEPPPPRELDPAIPSELERICLKALSKRASDRYPTAADLADDLFHWSGASSLKSQVSLRIVPKGLRSFDAEDADFFLDLLPGPRDRDGLPESIRFWKTRIEETDPDKTFTVGLIYGPSGCGKSSLVKAGLLPRLSQHVIAVYVEATAEETEARLRRGLRKHMPDLPDDVGLVEAMAALRRTLVPKGRKVVVILDQFEQWLHAKRGEGSTELVAALRHCDGAKVQAVCMVRDDFSMAASRFMKDVESRIVEGHNFATVDLFDVDHATRVLSKFGQAFHRLPEQSSAFAEVERGFLDSVVAGLAQDGKVVCVRIALFAEMVKGKPWTLATLQEVGGTAGIGVNFLEDTLSSQSANPEHRLHQQAAREVLKALLPEVGTDIKGTMRSHAELLGASGYADGPRDFADLLRILDGELRLITPTDPEGATTQSDKDPSSKYYQLTHDYLVPSLRDWLTRKQKETRRGRAELRLAERAALWNAKPENRYLPSWGEWLTINWLTNSKRWTDAQRSMMRKAGRIYYSWMTTVVVLLLVLQEIMLRVSNHMFAQYQKQVALGLVNSLLNAEIDRVPELVRQMRSFRTWADDELRGALSSHPPDSKPYRNAAMALLPVDAGQVAYLIGRLLSAEPADVAVLRRALEDHKDRITEELWEAVEHGAKENAKSFLPTASALALYDPKSERWRSVTPALADALVNENALRAAVWIELLEPIRRHLLEPLGNVYRNSDGKRSPTQIDLATDILERYAADDLDVLANLLLDAQPKQFLALYDEFAKHGAGAAAKLTSELERKLGTDASDDAKESLAKRQANAAVALVRLGQPERVWPLLTHSPDPRLRTWIIHRLSPMGASPEHVARRLDDEPEVSIRRALILALGEYEDSSPVDREALAAKLLNLYRSDSDAGIHGACAWVLRRWGRGPQLAQTDAELAKRPHPNVPPSSAPATQASAGAPELKPQVVFTHWYVTKTSNHTMVVIPGPVEFLMGSPDTETERKTDETLHRRRIGRRFAIAAKEVTVAEFGRFQQANPSIARYNIQHYSPEPECPQGAVDWYDAARYCRWLSEEEAIPEEQMCFPPIPEIKEGMKLPANYLARTGYRLPSEAEWEYACRAGAVTSRYYGQSEELLGEYAWYVQTSRDRTWPVAGLKPNDYGLFDMHGNVWEWCQEGSRVYVAGSGVKPAEDAEDRQVVQDKLVRVLRGGAFFYQPRYVRSGDRNRTLPTNRSANVGFRLARTYD